MLVKCAFMWSFTERKFSFSKIVQGIFTYCSRLSSWAKQPHNKKHGGTNLMNKFDCGANSAPIVLEFDDSIYHAKPRSSSSSKKHNEDSDSFVGRFNLDVDTLFKAIPLNPFSADKLRVIDGSDIMNTDILFKMSSMMDDLEKTVCSLFLWQTGIRESILVYYIISKNNIDLWNVTNKYTGKQSCTPIMLKIHPGLHDFHPPLGVRMECKQNIKWWIIKVFYSQWNVKWFKYIITTYNNKHCFISPLNYNLITCTAWFHLTSINLGTECH